jgi:hypothetical protein
MKCEMQGMLVRSLFYYGPNGSFSHPGRGHPTNPWLVGPVAQCYKERVGATAPRSDVHSATA